MNTPQKDDAAYPVYIPLQTYNARDINAFLGW